MVRHLKLIFEISKEHETIPKNEVFSCLKAEEIKYKIISSNEDVIIVNSDSNYDKINRIAERLSYTFFISQFLFSCSTSIEDIRKHAKENKIKRIGSIAISHRNRSSSVNSKPILNTLGKIYTKDKKVNLKNPDSEIRVLITNNNIYVGLKLAEIDRSQFEKRKVQHRPFFSPISLHPKLARALVNISLIKKDETLLDPFCGTGGIILEAGLIGARIIGSDIEQKMIDGCQKTLDFYKMKNYKLIRSDIGNIVNYVSDVDAVVTDFPYGKSTTTKGENIKKLYIRSFNNIAILLKKNGIAVIGSSDEDMLTMGEEYFSLLNNYKYRVHKSLTRYFYVYQR